MSFPRLIVFFYNAAREPLRALKKALFIPWVYDYIVPKTGYVELSNMALAWVLLFMAGTTVLLYFAISKFYKAKKLAIFLDNRPKKQQQGNAFQTITDMENGAVPKKQEELFEVAEEKNVIYEKADVVAYEEADLIPDEEEFKQHIHQIYDLKNAADSQIAKEQRECPFCGSVNNAEDKQCGFCGAELEL